MLNLWHDQNLCKLNYNEVTYVTSNMKLATMKVWREKINALGCHGVCSLVDCVHTML